MTLNENDPIKAHNFQAKRTLFKKIIPVVAVLAFGLAIWSMTHSLRGVNFSDVLAYLNNVPNLSIVYALFFTAAAFSVMTLYDFMGVRYAKASLPYRSVAPISFSAFAIGHVVGFASLSGGAIRFRAYSLAGLSAVQITIVVSFVSLTFALGASFLIGFTLLLEADQLMSVLQIPFGFVKPIGLVFIGVSMTYLAWASFSKREYRISAWVLKSPGSRIAGGQVLAGIFELSLTAAVLYVFLPENSGLSYLAFLGVFILAVSAGVISSLPGGLGAFESVLLLLLPNIPSADLLGAIVTYRFIFFILPLFIAIILIVWREIGDSYKATLQKSTVVGAHWASKVAPQALAVAVFISGASMVLGNAMPIGKEGLRTIVNWFSLPMLEATHLLTSAMGVLLLVLSRGLYQRLRGAYVVILGLMLVSIVSALVHSLNVPYLLSLSGIWLLVFLSRKEFYRGGRLLDQTFSLGWVAAISLVLISSIWLGFFANQNTGYANELWWRFALDANASRMLRAEMLAVVVVAAFVFAKIIRGRIDIEPANSSVDMATIKKIVQTAEQAEANVALLGDKRFLLHPTNEAFIMYQVSGGSWIALGDPVGNPQHFDELCWSFREQCDRHGARCVFYRVPQSDLPLYIKLGLGFFKLGDEARVKLSTFDLVGSQRADLRQAISRGNRDGATFAIIPAEEVEDNLTALKAVSDDWLAEKSVAEKGFSLGIFEADYVKNFDTAVIKMGDTIVAFATIWPTHHKEELSVDLMRFSKQAPKGVMDYLFVNLMLWGKEQGYQWFSLGMAPLAGIESHELAPLWNKVGNTIFHLGGNFYNFEGLHDYKEKFNPEWEPRYLACRHGLDLPRVLIDVALLISGGVKGLFSK